MSGSVGTDPNRPENVRLAIAAQPSIEQSIAALLRTVATHLQEAAESGDPTQLRALVDYISTNPRVWSDAVLAHTPSAPATIPPSVPMIAKGGGGSGPDALKEQPSLEQRIAALVRPIADGLQQYREGSDASSFQDMANQINEDPSAWTDALSSGLVGAPPPPAVGDMPGYVQSAFRDHGALQHDAHQRQQQQQQDEPPPPPERQPEDTGRLANERIATENREPEVVGREDAGAEAQPAGQSPGHQQEQSQPTTGTEPEVGARPETGAQQPRGEAFGSPNREA